jgi:hypothetical protein
MLPPFLHLMSLQRQTACLKAITLQRSPQIGLTTSKLTQGHGLVKAPEGPPSALKGAK